MLKFNQNRPKKILFSLGLKKGQEKAKWPNHFISRKPFQKRPKKADLAFLRAKWQPCYKLQQPANEEEIVAMEKISIRDDLIRLIYFQTFEKDHFGYTQAFNHLQCFDA